jgi:biotin carboxyl carrier protein
MSTEEIQGFLNIDSSLYTTRISKKFLARKKYVPDNPLIIQSYIPGTVLEIFVTPGKEVKKGEDLMIIDAMKMKNRIKSGIDGIVKTVAVVKGAKVAKGSVLVELE